jgi:hypothetical protein
MSRSVLYTYYGTLGAILTALVGLSFLNDRAWIFGNSDTIAIRVVGAEGRTLIVRTTSFFLAYFVSRSVSCGSELNPVLTQLHTSIALRANKYQNFYTSRILCFADMIIYLGSFLASPSLSDSSNSLLTAILT